MKKYILFLLFSAFSFGQSGLIARQNFSLKKSSFDADAQAFITAATITNSTQQNAINTLVLDLKTYGLWAKMKAIYPIVGGTAFTHKWNLKDPRDLDAAYRLVYTDTSPTHNSGGITGNSSGCETFLNALSVLSGSNNHLSNYCTTNTTAQIIDIGTSASGNYFSLYQSFSGVFFSDNTSSNSRITVANVNSKGFYIGTRTSTSSHKGYKDGSVIVSSTATITPSLPNSTIRLLMNNSGSSYYSNRTYAWFSIE